MLLAFGIVAIVGVAPGAEVDVTLNSLILFPSMETKPALTLGQY